MGRYITRVLKGLERIPNKRKQWEQDWDKDEVEKWIDINLKHKTLFRSKQEYLIKRYQNRKSEIETQTAIRKLRRHLQSREYKEFIDRHFNKVLPKAIYNEKLEYIKNIVAKMKELEDTYTKEFVEQYIREGRNVNNINTKNGIKKKVNKKIKEETGYNPEEIEGKSLKHLVTIVFPNFEKPIRPSLAEQENSDIFYKNDNELTVIEKIAKADPVRYVSTMLKIHEIRGQMK